MSGRKKIGITGAGGRIGGIIAKNLAPEYDLRLFVFDLPPRVDSPCLTVPIPSETVLKEIGLEEGKGVEVVRNLDFADKEAVKGKFEGLDVVLHLAANADPWESWDTLRPTNFDSTVNVYDESVRAKVKRVIFASSNHTQHALTVRHKNSLESLDQAKLKKPLNLDDPPFPDSIYAISKLFGEELGKLYAWRHGLESIALRIGWIKDFEKDNPSDLKGTDGEDYMRAIYLSHKDCIGYIKAAINFELKPANGIPYEVCYVCSKNEKRIWNWEDMTRLGYVPEDNAEKFFA